MGAAAIPLLVASTVVSAYGAYEQGQAGKRAGEYQAQVAKNNQLIAQQYAQREEQKGIVEEQAKRQQTAQQEGAIQAIAAGNGLDVSSGSPWRLQIDTAQLGELDASTIRNNAALAAYGYRVKGMNFGAEADLASARATESSRAGALGAFSSIIGGSAGVADKWAKYKSTGVSGF